MKSAQVIVLSGVDTTSLTGVAIPVNQIVSASFCPIFLDTSAAGTVKIQCSNDNPAPSGQGISGTFVPDPASWCDIPNATSVVVAGVAPAIVIPNMCFCSIRTIYTRTSGGSTTMTVQATLLSI